MLAKTGDRKTDFFDGTNKVIRKGLSPNRKKTPKHLNQSCVILVSDVFSTSHTCQFSESFMGETAHGSTFLTHFFDD